VAARDFTDRLARFTDTPQFANGLNILRDVTAGVASQHTLSNLRALELKLSDLSEFLHTRLGQTVSETDLPMPWIVFEELVAGVQADVQRDFAREAEFAQSERMLCHCPASFLSLRLLSGC
jgi:hypothetical protein